MTHTDYTRNILNIKDKNIYFNENCLEFVKIKGVDTMVFHGFLTYTPDYCPICGCINENNSIIKCAFKKGCKIKMNKISNYHTLLILDKQRFYCKNCNKTFSASTSLVDYYKQISNNVKVSVTLDLMKKGSEKDISTRNGISSSSSNRIIADVAKDNIIKMNRVLH